MSSLRRSARASARLEGVVREMCSGPSPGSVRSPTCGEEGRVRNAKKTKYRPQIRLHEIERGHPRLGVVDPARCDDEGRLLAGDQAFRPFLTVGKGPAHARNLVNPELENRRHAKVMHRHSDDVLIRLLQFGEQGVGERKQFLLLWSAGLFRRVNGTDPFRVDWRDGCCVEVSVYDPSVRVRRFPLRDERRVSSRETDRP